MVWIKSIWAVVSKWSVTAWEAIKKLPGWAVVAFLMFGAIVVHLLKRNALIKRRAEAQKRLSEINIEYAVARVEASNSHTEREDQLRKERDAGRAEIDEIEQQIENAAKEGPVALATQWKNYLARNKK